MPDDRTPGLPPPPPPPGWSDPAQHQIEPYRSPRHAARALLILMGVGLGIDLIGALSSWAEYNLFARAQRGEIISIDEANASDTRQAVIGGVQLLLFLVTIVVFIVWFRRMYRNLPSLGARNLRFTPGWAVGAWFVPFLNWVRPVQMTNDIWKASDPEMPDAVDTPWRSRPSTALIGFWWAAWIVSNFAGQFSFSVPVDYNDLDTLQRSSAALIVADIASVIVTLFAIALVWRMTARQEVRARRLISAELAA